MADLSRRNFLIGSGAMALSGAFTQQARAAYVDPDKVAKQLMVVPVEQWDANTLSTLNGDQRKAVIGAVQTLKGTVQAEAKLLIMGAGIEAQDLSLQDKMDKARQNAQETIDGMEKGRLDQLAAAQQSATDAAAQAALNPGVQFYAQQAVAAYAAAQNMAISMAQNEPQRIQSYRNMIDQAVKAEVQAEQARDAHNDPIMAFAPESVRMIPGQVRNREMDPDVGQKKATADLNTWYGRALDVLEGRTAMPSVRTQPSDGFQPPAGFQPPP